MVVEVNNRGISPFIFAMYARSPVIFGFLHGEFFDKNLNEAQENACLDFFYEFALVDYKEITYKGPRFLDMFNWINRCVDPK